MRFRLTELLIVMTCVAFTCAALVRADVLFECLFFSFTMALLFLAATWAIGKLGEQRIFWLGFSIIAGAYLGLAHCPEAEDPSVVRSNSSPSLTAPVPRHNGPELTTQLLRFALSNLHPNSYELILPGSRGGGGMFNVATQMGGLGGQQIENPPGQEDDAVDDQPSPVPFPAAFGSKLTTRLRTPIARNETSVAFMRCGHCAWALLLGWFAGHIASAAQGRPRRPAPVQLNKSNPSMEDGCPTPSAARMVGAISIKRGPAD